MFIQPSLALSSPSFIFFSSKFIFIHTMSNFLDKFDHLKIQLEDVKLATDDFSDEKLIGCGGFGRVYRGELSLPEGRTKVAVKRLDRRLGQGEVEFFKEITTLSKYKHENLVKLLHFCIDKKECILVYEFVSRGSLNLHLNNANLTWTQRIKICIGAAHALNYLHDPKNTHHRVIHCDIKSANILLDENWCAKITDFGLSKVGLANQTQAFLLPTNAVGTPGYFDPSFWENGILSKECDVYSFGVVLFEVMCGKLCCEYGHDNSTAILVRTWRNCFDENRLGEIVFAQLKEQIDSNSLMTFAAIANKCTHRDPKDRPRMAEIIEELTVALAKQVFFESRDYLIEFGKLAVTPLSNESEEELFLLLSKGFRYQDRKWLSVSKNGRVCEMISARECIIDLGTSQENLEVNSRFDKAIKGSLKFNIEVSPQFLVPHTTYTINLIYKTSKRYHGSCLPCEYKLDEKKKYSGPFIVELRDDGWFGTQLYQFTCHQREQHFTINCRSRYYSGFLILEGVEFRPVEYETEEEETSNVGIESISGTETICEQRLPVEYMDLIKLSKETIQWTNEKELYFLLRRGFLMDNGEQWFSISKNRKKRLMINARAIFHEPKWLWKPSPESRFGVVAEFLHSQTFRIKCEINLQLLSPETTYSCHLIYKLLENKSLHKNNMVTRIDNYSNCRINHESWWYIYLRPFHTPVIGAKDGEQSHNPMGTCKIQGHPKLRKDGWMECQLWKVSTNITETLKIHVEFDGEKYDKKNFVGLVVQGIEFRMLGPNCPN